MKSFEFDLNNWLWKIEPFFQDLYYFHNNKIIKEINTTIYLNWILKSEACLLLHQLHLFHSRLRIIILHILCSRHIQVNFRSTREKVVCHRVGFYWGTKEPGSIKILEAQRKSLSWNYKSNCKWVDNCEFNICKHFL